MLEIIKLSVKNVKILVIKKISLTIMELLQKNVWNVEKKQE